MTDDFHARKPYFTMMTNVPLDINREEIAAPIIATSEVTSLNLFQVYRDDKLWQRIGLVEICGRESVFRIASRYFLLKESRAVSHRIIDPESKLVRLFRNSCFIMQIYFTSNDRKAVPRVISFFEKFGQLTISSIKSKQSAHEVVFRAAPGYSICQLTTDTRVRIGDIDVDLNYPEEKVCYDLFSDNFDLVNDLELKDQGNQPCISQRINYFEPSHLNSISEGLKPIFRYPMRSKYTIDDDHLSVGSFEDYSYTSIGYNRDCMDNDANLTFVNYFSNPLSREIIRRIYGLEVQSPESFQAKKLVKNLSDLPKTNVSVTEIAPQIVKTDHPVLISDANVHCPIKKKPARHKRRKRGGRRLNHCHMSSFSDDDDSSYIVRGTVNSIDGSILLCSITSYPLDYESINNNVMPQLHKKWRRFVEIKDEMRKAKYHLYLDSKKNIRSPKIDVTDSALGKTDIIVRKNK